MKRFSVICLVIVIAFVFSMNVYPDGFTGKCGVSFTKTNDLYCFKGSVFNYENKMPLYSWPLKENSTSFDNFENYNYNGLLSAGHLLSESRLPNQVQRMERPRLSSRKIAGEIVLGIAGGVAFGIAGVYIAASIGGEGFDPYEPEGIFQVMIGYHAGSALGSALGVYLVGNSGNVQGSFSRALLGSALGAVLSIGSLFFAAREHFIITAATLPPIFASIYFNRSLRYKHPPTGGNALLNFREGRVRFGIPLISVQPLSDYRRMGKRAFMLNMNVLSIQL
ncbi:MAG: hypothetical protein KAW12_12175 [Candidatus Aminicenantes bacterium]|nr:hypothetical protein [Candidatus Aminicenantes bacterium]